MFAIICLSIACIANSIMLYFHEKELSKLCKLCRKLEAVANFLSIESPKEDVSFEDLRLFSRLQRFLESFDESKRVSEAVPSDEH